MKYIVQVLGKQDILERVSPCFQCEFASIRQIGNIWVLESSFFANCTTGNEVLSLAQDIHKSICRICSLYGGLHEPFSIGPVRVFDDAGAPLNYLVPCTPLEVTIWSAIELDELRFRLGNETLGSVLVRRAKDTAALAEALELTGNQQLTWSQIYDVIEFLGGAKGISEQGLAPKKDVHRFRRTATHYRHLGNRKRCTLPANPPTRADAGAFARALLKKWILAQLQNSPGATG